MVVIGTGTHKTQRATIRFGALHHEARNILLDHALRHTGQFVYAQAGGNFIKQVFDRLTANSSQHLADVGF